MFAWSVTVRQRYSKLRASSECENIRAHIPKAGKQISCSLHPLRSCQLSQLKRHLWYEPHRQCPISKCDGSRCLSSTSSILKSLAPSGLFFHCFCLNSLTTALSKHLTNPFLVASTLALHQNREMLDPDKFCSLCHSTFNNPVMAQQHYMGKKHRKQETKLRLMAHYGRLADPAVSDLPAGKGYPCKTCKIVLNSIEQYQAHVSGFKHKNQSPKTVVSPVSQMPEQTQPTPKDSSVVED